jgi:hypothetical protein
MINKLACILARAGFVALVGIGACGLSSALRPCIEANLTPTASYDDVALRHLNISGGADRLRGLIAGLPANRPLVIVGAGEDWTISELEIVASSLAWPRPVWCISDEAGHARGYDLRPPGRVHPGAILFYRIHPPVGWKGERVGENAWLCREA